MVAEFIVLPYGVNNPIIKSNRLTRNYTTNSWGTIPSYSFGLSRNIHSFLYVKTAINFTRFESPLAFDYKDVSGNVVSFSDTYFGNTLSLQLLPEARARYEKIYAFGNIGGGIYSVVSGVFGGNRSSSGNFNANDLNRHGVVFSSNGGVGFSMKGIGVFAGYGYSFYKPNNKNNSGLGIGYSIINFQAGVSYDF